MIDQPTTTGTTPAAPAAALTPAQIENERKLLQQDIRVWWSRFSKEDVSSLKSNDDLIVQLAAKYGLETERAQREAAAMLNGRSL